MKISYKGLKQLIDFQYSPAELDVILTNTGLEVEGIEEKFAVPGGLLGLVIGEVKSCLPHPNADKLKLTKVDIGQSQLLDIVCGAPNVAEGQKVVVATVGAKLYPSEGDAFEIKKSKIRGEVSEGMLCAEDEIGLGKGHAGILVLDTPLANGTPAASYFNLESDYVIEIGLTPNRTDGASHFGVARDIKAINGKEINLPNVEGFKTGNTKTSIKLNVVDTAACPRFCGLEINNITVQPSPDWLKVFLQNIGVNSINNIVDITNYICHFVGQPMHIFDADKIRGKEVIIQKPKEGTIVKTLDGIERKLSGDELAICDAEGPMAIAGVFGGEGSGVSATTKNIFLEVAYFNPDDIRRAATNHSLKTDASFRYERGTDPNMPPYAIKLATSLIQELAGGDICDTLYDIYSKPIEAHNVSLKLKNVDRLIGKTVHKEKVLDILESLDIEVLSIEDGLLELAVPAYRVDVTREADVIEEILRIYGFDQIEESEHLSSSFLSSFPIVTSEDQQSKVSQLLAANGFNEIQTLSIVKPSQNQILEPDEKTTVKLLNPLNEDLSEMRNSLVFSGMECLAYNINRRQKDLKLFEFGRVYFKTETEESVKYSDKQVLGLWITGNKKAETWYENSKPVEFFDLKKYVEKLLASMRCSATGQDDADSDRFEFGITYKLNNKAVAVVGKVRKGLLKKSDVKQDVYYAEIDWAYLLKKYSPEVTFKEISKFPEVRRDLSLLMNKATQFSQVTQVAQKTERKLLKEVNVFDVYEGDKIGADQKSYSVSFILQDAEKTLNDKVIDKTMQRLISSFENELGAIVRR
ncbi:phenylalanyl-tRNA synthetase beta subunit [Spirosomataceae bacterium TFI 002]|nr:phenylalanyl-tRNA synthetase beta subunit [Spirosomataceae bacterium TFI 002]